MKPGHRHKKLLLMAGSKGLILERLRRAPQTVDELAAALGLTGNAVRLQLAALEADGLVIPEGLRKTARRPSRTYRIAPGAEGLFCQAYAPFLEQLVGALRGAMSSARVDDVLRAAGRKLAYGRAAGPLPARVRAAAAALEDLGGVTEVVKRTNGTVTFVIHGLSCPLAAIAREHAAACVAVEALVAETTGAHAVQRCQRTLDPPRCVIEVSAPAR